MDKTLECCVCYNQNALYINCGHELCSECFGKLNKLICPICRGKIKGLLIEKPKTKVKKALQEDVIEVKCEDGDKTILLRNLNRFVFSNKFKSFLNFKLQFNYARELKYRNIIICKFKNSNYIIEKKPHFSDYTSEELLIFLINGYYYTEREEIASILMFRG